MDNARVLGRGHWGDQGCVSLKESQLAFPNFVKCRIREIGIIRNDGALSLKMFNIQSMKCPQIILLLARYNIDGNVENGHILEGAALLMH